MADLSIQLTKIMRYETGMISAPNLAFDLAFDLSFNLSFNLPKAHSITFLALRACTIGILFHDIRGYSGSCNRNSESWPSKVLFCVAVFDQTLIWFGVQVRIHKYPCIVDSAQPFDHNIHEALLESQHVWALKENLFRLI